MNGFSNNMRGWLATAVASMLFGSTYWVTSNFLPADSPLWGSALRALPAGIVLLLVARRLPAGAWWWKAAVLGTLNMGVFFLLLYIASQRLPSSVAASISALSPIVIASVAWLLIRERMTLRFLLSAALGVVGVMLIVGTSSGRIDTWGVAAVLTAAVLMAFGVVLSKRWNDGTPVLATTAWQLTAGGLELFIAAALLEGHPPVLSGSAIAAFGYISLIATAFGFVLWFIGFKYLPAGTVGMIALLNPVTGVLLGVGLGAESLTVTQIMGIALVLVGIAASQYRPRITLPAPSGAGHASTA